MPMIDRKLVLRTLCSECKRCNRIADSGGDPMPCNTYMILSRSPSTPDIDRAEILRLLTEISDTVTEAKNVHDIPFLYYDFIIKKLQEVGNIIKGGVNNG